MNLSERIKRYEDTYRAVLPFRMPVIVRVDGRAFHTMTRGCEKPFDSGLAAAMDVTAAALLSGIQSARFAYVQSDEISVLMIDYNRFGSQPWFDGCVSKIISIAASIASVTFTREWGRPAHFDARAFAIPERDVRNYFVSRQLDATRNSIQMATRALYSHKQCHGKNTNEMQEMMHDKGVNWNDYPSRWKRGRGLEVANELHSGGFCIEVPIFSKAPEFFDPYLAIEEE